MLRTGAVSGGRSVADGRSGPPFPASLPCGKGGRFCPAWGDSALHAFNGPQDPGSYLRDPAQYYPAVSGIS